MSATILTVNTQDLTDASSVEDLVTFPYISDNDGTLYSFINGDNQSSFVIRHSTEKRKLGAPQMDRHYVGFTIKGAPTDLYPAGTEVQAYLIFRHKRTEDQTVVRRTIAGVAEVALKHLPQLINGQGQF
uniref:Putative ORF3 n=1 Tax=Marine RNA phage MB TaxID=1423348 RepID=V5NGZ9_9VIRU|nr:putative ORF3 [Marine RNA phage MB]